MYIRMPYFNDDTNNFLKTEINKLFNKFFPQIKPGMVFFNNFKLKSFVNHKETLPKTFESMVVY